MLELENITWSTSDGVKILRGISLKLSCNEMVVITGPNGGGKTTLAKIICGILPPVCGRILLDGDDITNLSITERARLGISYSFQIPVRFKGLTVRDLLNTAAGIKLGDDEVRRLLSGVGLRAGEYVDREMDSSLSGGEMKRIEIATVLARRCRLSIFDEPEAGIDLWSFSGLMEVFERLKGTDGRAVMIISHQERIMRMADRIIVVENGRISKDGKVDDVLPHLFPCRECPFSKN